jgi:hypothetical protein
VRVSNFIIIQSYLARVFTFLLFFLPAFGALAADRNRTVMSYFFDNIVFQILYAGGYFTVAILISLVIISYFSKKFRQIFLSISLAIFGMLLLVFVYEALEDLEFIPSVYT